MESNSTGNLFKNSFEEFTSIEIPKELHGNIVRANEIAKELFNLDKKIKDGFEKIKEVLSP